MSIITISRGAFSGGQALSERVSSLLGYRSIDREVLIEASRRYGIPEAKLDEVLETIPHWWKRWVESLRLYRITLQAAMCEVAQGGNLIYHGRAGHELFPGIAHVLKVHLTAPLEFRIEQVKRRKGLDREAATQYIKQVDRARTLRLQELFGTDWRDPTRYDLVLNIAQMKLETAAHLIAEAVQREEYRPTPESEQAFQDLTIKARVQAALIVSPVTRSVNLNVRAEKGEVYVSGVLGEPGMEDEIVRLIENVPGVRRVSADLISAPLEEQMFH
jgi:cytidylate kinase